MRLLFSFYSSAGCGTSTFTLRGTATAPKGDSVHLLCAPLFKPMLPEALVLGLGCKGLGFSIQGFAIPWVTPPAHPLSNREYQSSSFYSDLSSWFIKGSIWEILNLSFKIICVSGTVERRQAWCLTPLSFNNVNIFSWGTQLCNKNIMILLST